MLNIVGTRYPFSCCCCVSIMAISLIDAPRSCTKYAGPAPLSDSNTAKGANQHNPSNDSRARLA